MTVRIEGDIRVPGDKSLTHRALMLAAAADGESRLSGLLDGGDCRSTAAVLRGLGCDIPALPGDGEELRIRSGGLESWHRPEAPLDCGNSGTTARLTMGLLAARPFDATITGDGSLRQRPMRRIADPLEAMGARVRELEHPDRLPLEIRGAPLRGIDHRSPRASAQIKSAVLLAGLSGAVPVTVREPIRSRDHTERMLSSLGALLTEESEEDGWRVSMEPPPGPLPPLEARIPGDISSAAFLAGVALLADSGGLRIRAVGTNPTRAGFVDAVRAMGGRITIENASLEAGEPVADLVVEPSDLVGTAIGGHEIPAMIDEIPILAVLAARADGETTIRGAAELRAKESDRIAALVSNFRSVGVEVEELADGLVVHGTDRPLRGEVRAFHDHRIAMAFAVLAALPQNRITIDQPDVVEISYPGFWKVLGSLTAK